MTLSATTRKLSLHNRFMKRLVCAMAFLLLAASCGHNASREHAETMYTSANQALYDQVMSIHDEVMPKLGDIYKAKTKLRKQLKQSPELSEKEKQAINQKIARLDSANEHMMVWMRRFDPIPDSAGVDKAKAYLEGELVKIRGVKEEILEALRQAQSSD